MLHDRARLARLLRGNRISDDQLEADIARSRQLVEARENQLPAVRLDDALPISSRQKEIEQAIAENQVTVVVGETGSGKSTQLPKLCLRMGRGIKGFIGHTQPRRIAARSVAARIAEELHTDLGDAVGYKVRFGDRVNPHSYIKVMTDGMLLAELGSDRWLDRYDTIIIDEAHERSLNVDFLLGYLKRLLRRRRELKLIVTSATIDPQRFSSYFDDAPIIEVSGRSYPVTVRYLDNESASGDSAFETGIEGAVAAAIRTLPQMSGDVLVFLPGEKEIKNTAELLRRQQLAQTEILPLYARLTPAEQQAVFTAHTGRRIVLATNVAETSLTVPGIRYVVDSGLARISRYRPGRQIQALPVEPVSKASAEQRKGRCGRLSDGICLRLYSEDDYESRPAFTEPEILRTSLAAVILKMKHLKLGDIEHFPFPEAPSPRMINDGYRLLEELGAVDHHHELSPLGRKLARIPVDPRLGRVLLQAGECKCVAEALVICSALAVQDPRSYPQQARERARECHLRYEDKNSEFISYMNLWDKYQSDTRGLSRNQTRRYCQRNFLSPTRMREWHDVYQQLRKVCTQLSLSLNDQRADEKSIHQALLAGFLGNIGRKQEHHEYLGTRAKKFFIHPGSSRHKRPPQWVLCAELIDTTRLYGRTIAAIRPEWIERAAGHLIKKTYMEPHFAPGQGKVMAYEQVALYGLVIVTRRKVHYGPFDPAGAREIFIRHGIVPGLIKAGSKRALHFQHHNADLIHEIEQLEHRSRRKDILISEDLLADHFGRHIPDGIYDTKGFLRWYRQASANEPDLLFLSRDLLMQHKAEHVNTERFPEYLMFAGNRLPCRYHFAPGHPNDGVTVSVPLPLLKHLDTEPSSWLVPGLLLERIICLIKALPKQQRKNFVPAPDHAERCLQIIDRRHGNLTTALSTALNSITGIRIDPELWNESRLPDHLLLNYEILDADGRAIAYGRDLDSLKKDVAHQGASTGLNLDATRYNRSGITRWDFGDLPESVTLDTQGVIITAYPTLVDDTHSVSLTLKDDGAESTMLHKQGLRRLLLLQLPDQARQLRKGPPGIERLCLNFATIGPCEALRQDVIDAALDEVLFHDGLCREERVFMQKTREGKAHLLDICNQICDLVDKILESHRACRNRLESVNAETRSDIEHQLERLIYAGFVSNAGLPQLRNVPRYLQAVKLRLERAGHSPSKDAAGMASIKPFVDRLKQLNDALAGAEPNPEASEYRWLLEEYRVSLFAQELKTARPVSAKRLEQKWRQIKQTKDLPWTS